jgi:hypothetical protein
LALACGDVPNPSYLLPAFVEAFAAFSLLAAAGSTVGRGGELHGIEAYLCPGTVDR